MPDGRIIAFVSDRTGMQEIFLMNADGSNQRKLAEGFAHTKWPSWLQASELMEESVGW